MRLLSWIFQPIYILFFIFIALLYIYREEVIPEHLDVAQSRALIAQMDQTAAYIEAKSRIDIPELSIAPPATMGETVTLQRTQVDVVTPQNSPARETIQPLAKVSSVGQIVEGDENAEIITDDETVVAPSARPEVIEQPAAVDQTEVDQTAVDLSAQPSVPDADEKKKTLNELWYAARKMALSGDREQAIEYYKQLTLNYPESADGFGELGNLYYALGDKEAALAAYRQALTIYQNLGRSGQYLYLQRVMENVQ